MREAGWYIVQVKTGREELMCETIRRACQGLVADAPSAPLSEEDDGELEEFYAEAEPLLLECFTPSFVTRLKYRGKWENIEKPLLPGYVIAVTSDPIALFHTLRKVRAFTRLLTMTGEITPLREDERTWIESFTKKDERVVPISIAYREGDTLVVTDGPLKGREALVKKVIRKKCLALLELHVGTVRITTTVGLAVMPKQYALAEAAAGEELAEAQEAAEAAETIETS